LQNKIILDSLKDRIEKNVLHKMLSYTNTIIITATYGVSIYKQEVQMKK